MFCFNNLTSYGCGAQANARALDIYLFNLTWPIVSQGHLYHLHIKPMFEKHQK